MSSVLALLVGAVVLAWTMVPLLRAEEEALVVDEPDGPRERLEARRKAIVDGIRDLDFEREMGKIDDRDHSTSRSEMMQEAAVVLEELDIAADDPVLDAFIEDEVRARRAGGGDAPCPSCGKANPKAAKFCDGCGTSLAGACAACGAVVRDGANFCGACGAKQ